MLKTLIRCLIKPVPVSEGRRAFLRGASATLIFAPAIVSIGSLMKLPAPPRIVSGWNDLWVHQSWLDPTLDAQMHDHIQNALMNGISIRRFDGHGLTDVTWAALDPEVRALFTKELKAGEAHEDPEAWMDELPSPMVASPLDPAYKPPGHYQRAYWGVWGEKPPDPWEGKDQPSLPIMDALNDAWEV